MTPDLPAELKATLDRMAQGLSRKDAARRADSISQTYRSGGNSRTIATEADALAYALARMPATYAAIAACLNAIGEIRPDFAPTSLIDVGAGPGTASWAAVQEFPSLVELTLLDSNTALRTIAQELAQHASRQGTMRYLQGDAAKLLADAPAADFVVASYIAGELNETERFTLTDLMWSKTRDTLLVVEPGTPAGYARIITMRERLIANGAHVAAPCPHDDTCPLFAPDWCHFAQRLARSRAHKHLKGAELPYEDEKFSYVAVSRTALTDRPARILAQPKVTKIAVTSKLCTSRGIQIATAPHRDKPNYSRARKRNWGDAISQTEYPVAE